MTRILSKRSIRAILRNIGVRPEELDQSFLEGLSYITIDMNKYQPDKGWEFLEEINRVVDEIESKGCRVIYMSANRSGKLYVFYQC